MSEHRLQTAIFQYLRRALPEAAFVTSLDAAFKGDPIQGAIRKARGIQAGIPDLHLTIAGGSYWLEVKTETGRLSEAQERVHDTIRRAGGFVAVVRSIADTEFQLREWSIPIRAVTLTPEEIDARLAAKGAPAGRKRSAKRTLGQVRRLNAIRSRTLF